MGESVPPLRGGKAVKEMTPAQIPCIMYSVFPNVQWVTEYSDSSKYLVLILGSTYQS